MYTKLKIKKCFKSINTKWFSISKGVVGSFIVWSTYRHNERHNNVCGGENP